MTATLPWTTSFSITAVKVSRSRGRLRLYRIDCIGPVEHVFSGSVETYVLDVWYRVELVAFCGPPRLATVLLSIV